MDRARRGEPEDEMRDAIVGTALEHHLVSRYTSLVAVDKTPARPRGAGLGSEQVASLLPQGQSAVAIFGMPATATGAALSRAAGAILIGLALLVLLALRRRRTRAFPVPV